MRWQLEKVSTDRLILRPLKHADLHNVYAYASDPDVTYYMDWPRHRSLEDSRAWLEEALTDSADDATCVFCLRETLEFAGLFSLSNTPPDVSLGYLLLKKFWGQGLATELGTAIVKSLMTNGSVKRIHATCDVANLASARVLEKIGLKRLKILESHLVRPNMPGQPLRDALFYALEKE